MAYAAEWDLDDDILEREEVEAVVQHVAAIAHVAVEIAPSASGLMCTFRFPVHAAAHVVSSLDPEGKLLGEEWYRDLDPPEHGEEAYTVRLELHGPIDGGRIDDVDIGDGGDAGHDGDADARKVDRAASAFVGRDEDADEDEDDGDDDDDDDEELEDDAEPHEDDPEVDDVIGAFDAEDGCMARLRVDSHDNREAWPVAFALATAVVERLGGDLRDDFDEDLFLQQLHLPRVTGPAVAEAGVALPAPAPAPSATPRWTTATFGDDDDDPGDDQLN